MFPPKIPQIVQYTNKLGKQKYSRWVDTTRGELLRFMGLWLMMSTMGYDNKREAFEQDWIVQDTVPGPKLKRFMYYSRFSQLSNCISFADMTVDIPVSDPWYPIRDFVKSFNDIRKANIIIGWLLCIDETMWKWSGLGLPHQSWIPRKPEPLGVESKTVADVESGILLYIELQEGKHRMQAMEYTETYQATTACTLRCCKNWFKSNAAVIGDSWFASVQTAVALAANGLHFIGNVKTATKGFPKKWLTQKLKDSDRGTSIYAKATGFYICL